MEGLWIVKFLTPDDPTMDLNGGVVVIETGRILGGDSGYFYVGNVGNCIDKIWPIRIKITRHDPDIISVFGDIDQFELVGSLVRQNPDEQGRPVMIVDAAPAGNDVRLIARLTRVSELP